MPLPAFLRCGMPKTGPPEKAPPAFGYIGPPPGTVKASFKPPHPTAAPGPKMEAALGPPTDKQRPLQLHTISIGSSSQEACVSVGDMDPALRIVTALRRLHTQTRRKIISWLALSDPRPGCLWQPQPPPQQPQLCVHKAPLIQDHPRYVHPLPPPNQLLSSCRCLQSTVRLSFCSLR